MAKYDSTEDTKKHIELVRKIILIVIQQLSIRARQHDYTKLQRPEKPYFDKFTPKLKEMTFGSNEYKKCLKQLQVALNHHYKNNSHHPQYYKNGISGMNLIDIIEMFCDWLAATKRMKDKGDIKKSIKINKKRFKYSDDLENIFNNTADLLEKELSYFINL